MLCSIEFYSNDSLTLKAKKFRDEWHAVFHGSTVNMAPGRYGPLSVYMAHQDGRYGPPLVDIAKTVIARLCLHYNIAIIVRKLEGWLEGKSYGNEPVSTKKTLFSNRGNLLLLILANNNIMSFSSLHRNTQGKRTVRTSYSSLLL